jgi:hypothetical protein
LTGFENGSNEYGRFLIHNTNYLSNNLQFPSLPRLLSLDKDVKGWGERLQHAADIAGIPLEADLDDSQIQRLACRSAAHGRAEWVLRWLLEKLKTKEGREQSRTSPLTFKLLRRVLLFIPPSTSARFFNSNDILNIIKNYLEETATRIGHGLNETNQTIDSGSSVTLEDSQPVSKKRKRTKADENDKSTKTSTEVAMDEQENLNSMGLFINEIIHLTDSSFENVDPVAAQHLKSVIRTSTVEAAKILGAWLRCMLLLCQIRGSEVDPNFNLEAIMRTHFAITQIWCSRSLEIDDDSGSSASTFSKTCLVPAVALYAQIKHDRPFDEPHLPLGEMEASLEKLLAKHLFVPGRASFSAASNRKKPKIPGTQNMLIDLLHPLQDMVVGLVSDDEHVSFRHLVSILPSLLKQAIKLCPGNSPKQKLADASWIECIVKSFSHCAGEPISYEELDSPKPDATLSSLQSMLQIVQQSQINLSAEFLESVLLGYSGLAGITKRNDFSVRWDLVIVLLKLDGSMFLKEKPRAKDNLAESEYTHRIPPYVEALAAAIENTKWKSSPLSNFVASLSSSQSRPEILQWSTSVEDAVVKVLVPLMHAYISARNLNGFMDLWFRELRRHWGELGGKNERAMPWASKHLRQEFQAALETSLTPARVHERFVEYMTPIKVLLNEAAGAAEAPKWAEMPTAAPASVSLFMLDTVLHGIQNTEALHGNIATWNALKGLSTEFAATDLKKFACSYKVWSILTQVYALSRQVDGEKSFQEQLVFLSSSQILEGALSVVGEVRPHQVDGFQFEAARDAYRFVIVVGSDLLEVPGLKERAEHYISTANNFLLHSISRLNPTQIFQGTQDKEEQALSARLRSSIAVLISCPHALSYVSLLMSSVSIVVNLCRAFTSMERCGIFDTIFYQTVLELDSINMPNSFPVLLKALVETAMSENTEVKGLCHS